jgi:hypothetical protein
MFMGIVPYHISQLEDRFDVETTKDAARPDRPVTTMTDENIAAVKTVV